MTVPTLDAPGDYLDGRFVAAPAPDGELRVHSPADLDDVVSRHPHSLAHVARAVEAAQGAAAGFRRLPLDRREALLRAYQGRLRAHAAPIADAIAREVGKPLWEARIEAEAMAKKIDLCIGPGGAYTATERIDGLPGEIEHRPVGVVAVIGPFNFPGHLPNGQIAAALLTGNAVVHKPSELAPSTGTWIARCLDEAGLPPGVFNLVQGPAQAGAALSADQAVDAVLFTGSTAAGRAIVAANDGRLDRVVALELGGKNASLVLDDCDLEHAARAVAFAAFATAGQRCTSTSRVIASAAIVDALADRLATLANGLRVGHPLDDDVFMGPVITEAARERILAAQRAAVDAGFEPICAGGPVVVDAHRGHYLRPALHRSPIAPVAVEAYSDAELFGPDIALYTARDDVHAIELANDTRFGLSAAVFCRDEARFRAIATELRVGVVHHNRATAGASGRLPFGGVGDSGNHRAAGIVAGLGCTYPVAMLLDTPDRDSTPTWPGFEPAPG